MLNSFLFVFAYLFSGINLIVFNRDNKDEDLMSRLTVGIITQLCLGAIGAKILEMIDIFINLKSMSVVYLIVGLGAWIIGRKNWSNFKVNYSKLNIYSLIVILIWFGILFMVVFTPNISLNYISPDPANHFKSAQILVKTGKMDHMYFASLYNAIFMEILQPFISDLSMYKAFIIADTFANLLNVFMFYCLANKFCKKKFSKVILPFICLVYFLGWPFYNYAIGGFVYFGWGVTLFGYIVWYIRKLENKKEQIGNFLKIIVGSYCVLECYMLFVPILILVIVSSMFWLYRRNIRDSLKLKIILIVCGVIFGVICYKIAYQGYFGGNIETIFYSFQLQGGIHRELYNDFLYLLPMILYVMLNSIKKKQFDVVLRSEILTAGYTLCMLVLCLLGYVSSYYYYKTYYLLWFFAWIICVQAIDDLYDKDKIILFSLGGSIVLAVLLGVIGIDNRYIFRDKLIVPTELTGNNNNVPFSIYGEIQQYFSKDKNSEDINELFELCQMISETTEINKSQLVFVSESYYTGIWFNSFVGGVNKRISNTDDLIKVVDECDQEYMVLHQNSELYREVKDIIDDKLELIYENGYYGLYRNLLGH